MPSGGTGACGPGRAGRPPVSSVPSSTGRAERRLGEEVRVLFRVEPEPLQPVPGELDARPVKGEDEADGPGLFVELLDARRPVPVDAEVAEEVRLALEVRF